VCLSSLVLLLILANDFIAWVQNMTTDHYRVRLSPCLLRGLGRIQEVRWYAPMRPPALRQHVFWRIMAGY
jgi:hypothetical protein